MLVNAMAPRRRPSSNDVPDFMKELARENRENPTEEEAFLWEHINNGQLGVTFWRQHAVGQYIVDFYCREANLAIEVDGPIHKFRKQDDAVRERHIVEQGIRILRFTNWQVLNRTQWVLNSIREAL